MIPASTDQLRWFSEKIYPHEKMLRAWLAKRFPSLRDIDDVIHDAYVRVLKVYGREGLTVGAPKAFLFATARNRAIDLVRSRKYVKYEPVVEDDGPMDSLRRSPMAVSADSYNPDTELLKEAIQSLPDRCREVFTLRKIYGYSHEEISDSLGISVNTVAAQISTGIRKCRAFIESECGGSGRPDRRI